MQKRYEHVLRNRRGRLWFIYMYWAWNHTGAESYSDENCMIQDDGPGTMVLIHKRTTSDLIHASTSRQFNSSTMISHGIMAFPSLFTVSPRLATREMLLNSQTWGFIMRTALADPVHTSILP